MTVRPGQCQDYCENQGIRGDIQIEVGQAVHQNCRDTPDRTQRDGTCEALPCCPVVTDSSYENPEDRAKHQDATGQAELACDLQVITVRMLNEESEKRSLNGRINQ